ENWTDWPAADAVSVWVPASGPRVQEVAATPWAFVVDEVGDAEPSAGVHETETPETGLPN
ncbi:MAG: hypothetical protein WD960_10510, partial [Gemmatimonadota bacterium]